jgi:carboxyl-terminal processing protease
LYGVEDFPMMKQRLMIAILTAALLSTTLAVAGQPDGPDAAEAVLDAYVAAIGGHEAWSRLENSRSTTENETFGAVRRSVRTEELRTGRFHHSVQGPEGELEHGFDGEVVWRRAPWARGILPETDRQGKSMSTWRQRVLRDWRTSGREFSRLADETIDGKRYLVVATSQPDEAGHSTMIRYLFDPETHLLERTIRGNPDGALQDTTIYSDYRRVGDVLVPFETVTENPQVRSASRMISWEANLELPDSLFSFEATDGSAALPVKPGTVVSKARAASGIGAEQPIKNAPVTAGGELSEELRLQAFDSVWRKINESYWDPTFGGKDWKKIGDTYRQRALAASDSKEFHEILNEMANQLGRTHFRVRGPDQTRTVGSNRPMPGTVGMLLRGIDGQVVVTKVEEDQPAANEGVLPGFIVTGVNGRPITELRDELIVREPVMAQRPDSALQRAAAVALAGDAGGVVTIEFLDQQDRKVTKKLVREEVAMSALNRVELESRWLDDGTVGYIRLSSFMGDAAERMRAALVEMRDAEAIVLDLRGNGGGAGDLAPAIAGMFAREKGSLGSSRFRHSTREFSYEPFDDAFTGELLILVDGGSASTSELLAAGLQESGRATIVGTLTRGAVLPSLLELLPTGGSLQYVISDLRTPSGIELEGRGVVPDVESQISRADLISGADPVLEAAVAKIRAEQL